MELDDYIRNLNADLVRQIQELNNFSFCPECGSRVDAGNKFCPECGTCLSADPTQNADATIDQSESECSDGILFTDTKTLAEKYGCNRNKVQALLRAFMTEAAEKEMHWQLLDAADYRQQLGTDPSWLDYNELLSDYMREEGYSYGMQTPVFIIGGDDVIPIPMVEDTFGTSDTGQMPCDMCYCFPGHFFSDLWDGDRTIEISHVRNTVARLPLEDSRMQTSIEDDLEAYFNLCSLYYDDGIPADYVMMTSNSSWLPASRTMSEHLPLIYHTDDEDLVEDNMYVSPPVAPDNDEAVEPVSQSMGEAGMLLFNLHGAGQEGMSSFYSDEGEAFSTDMLEYTSARVFNTVACYGARYHGFERDDSMILSAFYHHGFLLYAGSLIPVPMTELDVPEGVEVHEGSGSEHLMPIFCMEQYAGLPAGEAMMKAKLEYFNTFRHMEHDDFSMATMQMFSLYGNPMLRLQRNDDVLRRAAEVHVLPVLPQAKQNGPVRVKRMQRVMLKNDSSSSLLSDIRGAVNSNLDAIHAAIANDLYAKLGLEPRTLHHVDEYSIPNGDGSYEKGYMYGYENEDRAFANKTWVEVSDQGKIKRIFKTKSANNFLRSKKNRIYVLSKLQTKL